MTNQEYAQASQKTAGSLMSIAHSLSLSEVSHLSLPEIEAISEKVGQMVPAGNVPGVILNGLARLSERRPPANTVKRDIGLLFRGVRQTLDTATYWTLFGGPAAVIGGYQYLLKLAGIDPDATFAEGVWQFYVDYALRDDTARHANEVNGFDIDLQRYNIQLSPTDRATAWAMAAITTLHQYNDLLANEWRERVYTYALHELAGPNETGIDYPRLSKKWLDARPFRRGEDAGPDETFAAYRRRKFETFLTEETKDISPTLRQKWQEYIAEAEMEQLPAYQQQMTILSYLEPGFDGETRTPISLKKANIGLVYQGQYYLISACTPQTDRPADVEQVRAQIVTLMNYPANSRSVSLIPLAKIRRMQWPDLRRKLSPALVKELDILRSAPILLNLDQRSSKLHLAQLRQAERGIGDHALTLFDTGQSMVMDQSHIFFDGTWGAGLAEILVNEALSWAVYLSSLPDPKVRQARPHAPTFKLSDSDRRLTQGARSVLPETSAETEAIKLPAILSLRRLFKRRNDLLQLTVNDLLVLYRAIHAITYQPPQSITGPLQALHQNKATRNTAETVLAMFQSSTERNPALVIPVDGSVRNPRERLFPITFEVPLRDLDLLDLHRQCRTALGGYQGGSGDREQHYRNFDQLQRTYLKALASFGAVLSRAKEIAIAGESAAVGTIKLLAHMPAPLQRMLDQIPNRIDILNDLIKGREVFSNVGAVVPSSTLTRFATAKDDNDKKTLAWGVLTDARGTMRITLRDFRPHVRALQAIDEDDLAQAITQDYLDSYATGLNTYVKELRQITETSRETRLARPE